MTTDVKLPNSSGPLVDDYDDHGSELGVAVGPCCKECGAPGEDLENSWCLHCGFYSKYGTYVDVSDGQEGSDEPTGIPSWAIKLAAIFVGTAVVSLVLRFVLSPFPVVHTIVGTSQLLVGMAVFCALHLVGFLNRSLKDGGAKLMDLLSPFAIWGPVIAEMPKTERRVVIAWSGFCAMFFSLVTGGLPTGLLDFKATPVEEQKEEAGPGGVGAPPGDGNMEDAVRDFAEKGTRMVNMPGEDPGAGKQTETEVVAEEELEEDEKLLETECMIVGYIPALGTVAPPASSVEGEEQSGADAPAAADSSADPQQKSEQPEVVTDPETPKIRALIVASRVGRKLCVVGYVSEGVTVGVADQLLEKFADHVQPEPFVPCAVPGVWLAPKFVCKVKYKEWDNQQGLLEPQFDKIIQEF
ncbi:MAG: hypothetical protein KDB14_15210 [Planctomycetales bacterium]|nr:hypothetical protein [Planctomycetales bacterium]